MTVYAGIDEAGYGPMFGPFVIACAVFRLDSTGPDEDRPGDDPVGPPDLWHRLDQAVCRTARDRRRRIAVNDSKKLYSPSAGLKHLERAVLAMLRWSGRTVDSLEQLLQTVAIDPHSLLPDLLWYGPSAGPGDLPACHEPGSIAVASAQLARAGRSAGVQAPHLAAAVVYEHRFNRMVQATGSKARCAWTFVSAHLQAVFNRFGKHQPVVIVDRQGGRQHYRHLLQLAFPHVDLRIVEQSPLLSRYHLTAGPRAMTVQFQVDAEQSHLPVALASMLAKYLRQLLMERFNRFWTGQIPNLKPTAGYVTDGRRFLRQIESALDRLGIDPQSLIRIR